MTDTRWWKYVQAVAGDAPNNEIADRVGIDKSNVTRWKQGNRPAVEFVLKFARSYGRPVIEALAEGEYITDAEAGIREVQIGVADLGTIDLARELLARVESAESEPTPLRALNVPTSADDLEMRRPRTLNRDKIAAKDRTPRETDQHAPGEHPADH
jgi:transcriptional regulator with XRE-family HTH domain